ncbi:protein FLX-like 4 [Rutidosis leptorrhynchoides]|uniref:protein FLX-like 4 n=1 Tax=Rutidosis leptorrhynchoides TaxID=125765 RepID=UPI003A99DF98
MSSRGHGQPSYGSRSTQPQGILHHVGQNIEPQRSAEIERLASDKQRLAAIHVALRQDLVATQQDIQKLRAHIGSIQTESDVQIRIFLEKMAKMEPHIKAGENVKKDLQQAHTEARALVATRKELIDKVKQATEELDKVRADVEKLPEMNVELDRLRQEHQKLRSTFEHEKAKNMEKVAQMEVMEKDLLEMAKEVERLRAEVLKADQKANAPAIHSGTNMNQEVYPPPPPQPPQPPQPPHIHASGGGYVDGYGNHVPMGLVGAGAYGVHPRPGGPIFNPQWGPPHPMVHQGGPHPPPVVPGGIAHWRARGPPPYDNSYPRN